MAVRKAILITEDNAQQVLNQFELSGWSPEELRGLYLVAGFGSAMDWDLLGKVALENSYNRTGKELENGFFEIERK